MSWTFEKSQNFLLLQNFMKKIFSIQSSYNLQVEETLTPLNPTELFILPDLVWMSSCIQLKMDRNIFLNLMKKLFYIQWNGSLLHHKQPTQTSSQQYNRMYCLNKRFSSLPCSNVQVLPLTVVILNPWWNTYRLSIVATSRLPNRYRMVFNVHCSKYVTCPSFSLRTLRTCPMWYLGPWIWSE